MLIIPKDTRYLPLTQQKSCCVPASISIVMYKLGLPLLPQELLGYHLGLIVAEEDKPLFWHPRTGKRPLHGYGTQIGLKAYDPNLAFKRLDIQLKMTIHPIDQFKTESKFIAFVTSSIREDKHMLVCFHQGKLSNDDKQGGHVCVIDKIYPHRKIIRLIDPSPNRPKWREVKISLLKKAMELHPTNGGAFWELEKIS